MPIGWMKDNRRNIKFFFIAAIRYSSDKACAGKLFNQLQRQESSNVLDRGIEGRCFLNLYGILSVTAAALPAGKRCVKPVNRQPVFDTIAAEFHYEVKNASNRCKLPI